MEGRAAAGRVWPMELSVPASLPGQSRRAAASRASVPAGMASEAADDVVLALNEAATNAILYGSCGG
jgi:anti-sigma regulatory factor (Ser/Thr protein kinase)